MANQGVQGRAADKANTHADIQNLIIEIYDHDVSTGDDLLGTATTDASRSCSVSYISASTIRSGEEERVPGFRDPLTRYSACRTGSSRAFSRDRSEDKEADPLVLTATDSGGGLPDRDQDEPYREQFPESDWV